MQFPGRVTGTVKHYSSEKGFGFISPHDGSGDIFVHYTNIQMEGFKSLGDGEQVEYQPFFDAARGKTSAVCVTGPGGAPLQGNGGSKGMGKGAGAFPPQGFGGQVSYGGGFGGVPGAQGVPGMQGVQGVQGGVGGGGFGGGFY